MGSDQLASRLVPSVSHTSYSSSLQVPEVVVVESLPRMPLVTIFSRRPTLPRSLLETDHWPRVLREMPHTLLSRMTRPLNHTVLMLSALTWVALSHGQLPTTSSCALVTDPNTLLMDTSSVDLPLFLSPLLTATRPKMERSPSPPGPKQISEREERDGGIKLPDRPRYRSIRLVRI